MQACPPGDLLITMVKERTSAGLHLRPCQRDLVDFKLCFLQEED